MIFFLDTNVCIYFLNGSKPNVKKMFEKFLPKNIKIPSIVKAELLYGALNSANVKSNIIKVNSFLDVFDIISFDSKCSEIQAKLRYGLSKKGKIIGPHDLLIAAIAIANNGTLISNNIKEFKRITDLKLENWCD